MEKKEKTNRREKKQKKTKKRENPLLPHPTRCVYRPLSPRATCVQSRREGRATDRIYQ